MKRELKQIQTILTKLSGADLENVKDLVDEQIEKEYNKKENFMLHDRIDEYIYRVYYKNGNRDSFCVGRKAYDAYIQDDDIVSLYRITKDLFPTQELLLQKY